MSFRSGDGETVFARAPDNLRRFAAPKPRRAGVVLPADHAALREPRTIFPSTVMAVGDPRLKRILKSGVNSPKIGNRVQRGPWEGFPIFTLTLEERKTCPATCAVIDACYGNGMHYAQRIVHDRAFEEALWEELALLQQLHPGGFVVRLHVLGDFYSTDYVELWAEALESYPALNVFGYTARDPHDDPIGSALAEILGYRGDRFRMRFSGWGGATDGSVVVDAVGDTDHVICPAQVDAAACCATCGFCFQSDRTIAFLRH
jgi:hypothetical protein